MEPKRGQMGLKQGQMEPKMGQMGLKQGQMEPKMGQMRPEMGQMRPKMGQICSKCVEYICFSPICRCAPTGRVGLPGPAARKAELRAFGMTQKDTKGPFEQARIPLLLTFCLHSEAS